MRKLQRWHSGEDVSIMRANPRAGGSFTPNIFYMMLRNTLTLRSRKHRKIQKWIFALIFAMAVLGVCWLLV
jgi:hypothetical protein